MEMERCESEVVVKRKQAIVYRTTFIEKGIKIPNLEQFMWTQTKQNYDKHVEWMENLKDIAKEEDWAFKLGLVPLFMMDWHAPMPDVMLEFLNTFFYQGCIYLLWA